MNKSAVIKIVALVLAAASGSARAAPVGPVGPLPARTAIKAATAALDACAAAGYRVTVTIVDREGVTRAQLVGDGAGPLSISTSRRKAYTAAALGLSTADYAKLNYTGPVIDPELIAFAGGLPLLSHGAVIGAIGVGGADRADRDEVCAKAGLDAVADLLNGS